jgi:hypothetical protein
MHTTFTVLGRVVSEPTFIPYIDSRSVNRSLLSFTASFSNRRSQHDNILLVTLTGETAVTASWQLHQGDTFTAEGHLNITPCNLTEGAASTVELEAYNYARIEEPLTPCNVCGTMIPTDIHREELGFCVDCSNDYFNHDLD